VIKEVGILKQKKVENYEKKGNEETSISNNPKSSQLLTLVRFALV
jgi:hypothetical protein